MRRTIGTEWCGQYFISREVLDVFVCICIASYSCFRTFKIVYSFDFLFYITKEGDAILLYVFFKSLNKYITIASKILFAK